LEAAPLVFNDLRIINRELCFVCAKLMLDSQS
jgi:hypothetical protein